MTGDQFRHDAGPYLLGALDEPDRAAFAAHLPGCAACREEVARLRPVVALLGMLTPGDAALLDGTDPEASSPPPDTMPPDTMLPGLLARASRRTRRRRAMLGAVGATAVLAAAAVVALVVVLLGRPGGAPPPQAVVMQQVTASPVAATVAVTSRPWGTEITLDCRYQALESGPEYPAPGGPAVYTLRVTDIAGATHELGSWTLGAGQQAVFTGGTAVPRMDIRKIEVVAADGTPRLSAAG